MNKYAIIVAGGKGLRMGGELPKQFLPLSDDRPVLMHTLEAFYTYDSNIKLILILPRDQQSYWKAICEEKQFNLPHQIAEGGEMRFHSVKNGLALITENGLVGVHDGVRPFVSAEVIARCYEAAIVYKAVIPVIEVVETIRHLTTAGSETVDRSHYRMVQTPQIFDIGLLKEAYAQDYTPFFTDDASVVEALGTPVILVEGNRENIKITTPFDLKIASTLM